MLQLRYQSYSLPFRYPFTIAKGTKTHQQTMVVSLAMGPITGWGEAPVISYYEETIESMRAELERTTGVISRYALTDPHRFWHFLHHLLPGQTFLTAALDMAGWDLFARLRRKSLGAMIGVPSGGAAITDYTIGLDTTEMMVEKINEQPWPIYKIKMASPDDIDVLRSLRQATDSPFRVDMNEGWSYEDILRLLPELKKLGVELVEQPLPKGQWEEMEELKGQSPLPLIADEACREEGDVAKCAKSFHGINIKLTKCGGITPALRMIDEAKKAGLKVMLGNMNESTIGSAVLVHLAPLVDFLDVDGPLLLSEDLADGLHYNIDGTVQVSAGNGLGIRFWGEPRIASPFAATH